MKHLLLIVALIVPISAFSQEEVFELSPFILDVGGGVPPVTIKRTGDFLVLSLNIVNDTRIYSEREKELYSTVRGMVELAKGKDIILNSGEYDLSSENYKVKLQEASQKVDTTFTNIYAKVKISENSNVAQLSDQLREFASQIEVIGRTEVFPAQIGISIVNPEKYRYEVMEAIAADLKKTKEILGEDFKVRIRGLDQRLEWRRVSVSMIEIYLPYEFVVLPIEVMDW